MPAVAVVDSSGHAAECQLQRHTHLASLPGAHLAPTQGSPEMQRGQQPLPTGVAVGGYKSLPPFPSGNDAVFLRGPQ